MDDDEPWDLRHDDDDDELERRERLNIDYCSCDLCMCMNETEFGATCRDCLNHAHQG